MVTHFSNARIEPPVDVGIVTALDVEREAVCRELEISDDMPITRGNRIYWCGRLKRAKGDPISVAVAQCVDSANIDSALVTNDLLHIWRPRIALVVGIAGSAGRNAELGDVVLGERIYYYDKGKIAAGCKPQPDMFAPDTLLLQQARALPWWPARIPIPRPDGTANRPGLLKNAVIASGEKVIACEAARDSLASAHRKIEAFEMEAYGFSKAIWESEPRARGLVVRSICDNADSMKGDEWHAYASAAAASFAVHLVRNLGDSFLAPRESSDALPPAVSEEEMGRVRRRGVASRLVLLAVGFMLTLLAVVFPFVKGFLPGRSVLFSDAHFGGQHLPQVRVDSQAGELIILSVAVLLYPVVLVGAGLLARAGLWGWNHFYLIADRDRSLWELGGILVLDVVIAAFGLCMYSALEFSQALQVVSAFVGVLVLGAMSKAGAVGR